VIGISIDNRENSLDAGKYESPIGYSRSVAAAGGLPLLLPQEAGLAAQFVAMVDGLILTGGDDPHMEAFGDQTHAACNLIEPQRQAMDLALLQAASKREGLPVLGICLGMQLMALTAGARMIQHLPDEIGEAAECHQGKKWHDVTLCREDTVLADAMDEGQTRAAVVSAHHQGFTNSGRLRAVAHTDDGVVEAIDDPARAYWLGVQWHPERGGAGPLNARLFASFVDACRGARKG
jgi:putative glutamine amidotransferase